VKALTIIRETFFNKKKRETLACASMTHVSTLNMHGSG